MACLVSLLINLVLCFFFSSGFFLAVAIMFITTWLGFRLLKDGVEGDPGELWAGAVIVLLISLFALSAEEKTPLLIVFIVNIVCGVIFLVTEENEPTPSTPCRNKSEVWEVKKIRRVRRRR